MTLDLELNSDSFFKEKLQKEELGELSIDNKKKPKQSNHLIQKEIMKSLKVKKDKWVDANLSEGNYIFNSKNAKFMSSEDFNISQNKPHNTVIISDQFSNSNTERVSDKNEPESLNYKIEATLKGSFITKLKNMMNNIFNQISFENDHYFKNNLKAIVQDKDKINLLLKKIKNSSQMPSDFKLFEKKYEKNYYDFLNVLSDHMEQSNKYKGLLVDFLMCLDQQCLELSKTTKLLNLKNLDVRENVHDLENNLSSIIDKCLLVNQNESNEMSTSWFAKNSLQIKGLKNTFSDEKKHMESVIVNSSDKSKFKKFMNQCVNKKSSNINANSHRHQLKMNSEKSKLQIPNPNMTQHKKTKIMNKFFSKNHLQSYLSDKHSQNSTHTDGNFKSSMKKFDKQNLFKVKPLNYNSDKYSFFKKNTLKNSKSLIRTPKANKNFTKKKAEFKDEISDNKLTESKLKLSIFKMDSNNLNPKSISNSQTRSLVNSHLFTDQVHVDTDTTNFDICFEEIRMIIEQSKKDLELKKNEFQEKNNELKELKSSLNDESSDLEINNDHDNNKTELVNKHKKSNSKYEKVLGLEKEVRQLNEQIGRIENKIKEFEIQNENKLTEINQIVKSKFKEIESKNEIKKEIQKDLMIKNNIQLQCKNTEINILLNNYKQLRAFNNELSKKVPQHEYKKQSTLNSYKNQITFSKTPRGATPKTFNLNQSKNKKISTHIDQFEIIIEEFKNQIKKEEQNILKIKKEKEFSKKEVIRIEKSIERKRRDSDINTSKSHGHVLKLELLKVQKNKSVESKIKMIKSKNKSILTMTKISELINKYGYKLIEIIKEQNNQLFSTKNLLNTKDEEVEHLLKKESYLMKLSQTKESTITQKNSHIQRLESKLLRMKKSHTSSKSISDILNSEKQSSIKSKSNLLVSMKKKNLSSNNLTETLKAKKRLYNKNKTHRMENNSGFYKNKIIGDITDNPHKSSITNKSVITRAKSPIYSTNPFKNNKSIFKQRDVSVSSFVPKKNVKEMKGINYVIFEKLKVENNLLKSKYQDLKDKYNETHSDLLRSKKSIDIETRRAKKKFEQNLNESHRKKLGHIKDIIKSKLKQLSLVNDVNTISEFDIQEIYDSVHKQIQSSQKRTNHLTHKSEPKTISQPNLMVSPLQHLKDQRLRTLKSKFDCKLEVHTDRLISLESKLCMIKKCLSQKNENTLKGNMALKEIELGESIQVNESKEDEKDLKGVKEELEIEQKNNLNLRQEIKNLRKDNLVLQEKVKEQTNLGFEKLDDQTLIEKNKELHLQVEDLEKKKNDVEKQVKDIQKKYKMNYKKITELKNEIADKDINYDTLTQNIQGLQQDIKEKDIEIERLSNLKGAEINQQHNDELENNLLLGNQENERLNSLIDEKTLQIDSLHSQINLIEKEKKLIEQENQKFQIKLNLISQLHKDTNLESKQILDVVIDNPRVTEFATNGMLGNISFKNIITQGIKEGVFNTNTSNQSRSFNQNTRGFNTNASNASRNFGTNASNTSRQFNTNTSGNSKKINMNMSGTSQDFGSKGLNVFHNKESNEELKDLLEQKRDTSPLTISDNTVKDNENEKDSKFTININNININHLNFLNDQQKQNQITECEELPALKNSQSQKNLENNSKRNVRESYSLENNIICSNQEIDNFFTQNQNENKEFNKELPNDALDCMVKFDKKNKEKDQSVNDRKSKKSEIQKFYLDEAEFSEGSSFSSMGSKPAKKSTHGNSVYGVKPIHMKNKDYNNSIQENEKSRTIKFCKDPLISPKSSVKRIGLIKKKKNSNSLEKMKKTEKLNKNLLKSVLSNKSNLEEVIEKKGEEISYQSIKKPVIEDSSDSDSDDLFGEKKVNDSGVFSKREILNAFEHDDVLDQMMQDNEVQPGETALAFSQRYVSKQEELNREKKANDAQANQNFLTVPNKENKKTVFDMSFNNQSFAQQFNTNDFGTQQSMIEQAIVLNNEQSFAAQDPLAFVSSSSFGGPNIQTIKILDEIKKDSQEKESQMKSNFNPDKNLSIVPEESEIKNDFKIIDKKNQIAADQFNSMNSLNLMSELVLPPKHSPSNKHQDKNMLDLMKGFDTGLMDTDIFDKIIKKEDQKKESGNDVQEKNRFTQDSDSDSDFSEGEDMCFGLKKLD